MKRLSQLHLTIALLLTVCNGSFAQLAGYALQFDGVNDYVDLPESASLTTNFTNQITIEAWIHSDNYLNASVISSGNQNDYAIAVLTDGRLRVDMYGIDAGIGAFFSRSSLTTNTWYHIAVTYDSLQETIFIDGIADTARSASGNIPTSPQTEDIRIGSYSGAGPNFFRGIIDEVRIWNIGRTQSEIQQTMNDTLTGSEPGLVGYWRFDEGSGTIAYDLSSHGNDGTLVNGPTWMPLSPPNAPQNLVASAGNNQVTLRWSQNTESDFLRYRIYGGTSSNPTTKVDSTTGGISDTSKTIAGLTNASIYYFRITALDSTGNESEYSNEVSAIPHLSNFAQHFDTDIFSSGEWLRTDSSVTVNLTDGWLHISSDGDYGDFAEKVITVSLPFVIETRLRLVSGGQNYTLPDMRLYYSETGSIRIGYLPGSGFGWAFGIDPSAWQDVHTNAPGSENLWWAVRARIDIDGGELYAKSDTGSSFAFVLSNTWTIPDTTIKISFTQPWDAVFDVDFVKIYSSGIIVDPALPTISLSVATATTMLGDTILVPVSVSFPSGRSYSSAEVSFAGFQNAGLTFLEVDTVGTLIGQNQWLLQVNNTDSLLITAAAGAQNVSGDGILYRLKFVASGNICSFVPITITRALFNTGSDSVISSNGGVYIDPIPNYGDVDENGLIQAFDASLILRHLAHIDTLGCQGLANANVSNDTTVSALDALLILMYVVGLIDHLPYDTTIVATGNIAMIGGPAGPGDTVAVPVILSNGSNIVSFEGLITFDQSRLTFSHVQWSGTVANFAIQSHVVNGQLYVAGAGTTQNGNTGTFATLYFINHQTAGQTQIIFRRLRWNEGVVMENVASATVITGVNDQEVLPTDYALEQSYPNPFNPSARIRLAVPVATFVTVRIFNGLGQEVAVLVNEHLNPGRYEYTWFATGFPSGVYFYRMQAGAFSETKKLILLK